LQVFKPFYEKVKYHIKIFNRLQVLVDFKLFACLNIDMPNPSRSNNLAQNVNTYLNVKEDLRSKREDVHFLMKRLKNKEQKKIKEKIILMTTAVSVLVIFGIIISF